MRGAWDRARLGLFVGPVLAFVLFIFSKPVALQAAVTSSTLHGSSDDSLNGLISGSDLIQGRQTVDFDVYENPMDSFGNPSLSGWHPANTDPADQLAAFTDGSGIRSTGLTGLLNDNFVGGVPSDRVAKIVEYPFDTPVDIGRINIFSGNRIDPDGRIFSTTYIEYSTDNAFTFQPLGYFQSDPSGTPNNRGLPVDLQRKSTLVAISDDSNATMISGVTNLIFNFYSVDNTLGEMRDPFNGTNMFTGVDDGLTAANTSPLIFEIDVLEPSTAFIGDYNGNNVVDAADYTVWRDSLGTDVAPGSGADGSGDGTIDETDYLLWKLHFGETNAAGAGSSSIVPEPTTTCMLLASLIAAARTRKKSGGRSLLVVK